MQCRCALPCPARVCRMQARTDARQSPLQKSAWPSTASRLLACDASWSETTPSSAIQFWVCSLRVSASWLLSHDQVPDRSQVLGTWRPIRLTCSSRPGHVAWASAVLRHKLREAYRVVSTCKADGLVYQHGAHPRSSPAGWQTPPQETGTAARLGRESGQVIFGATAVGGGQRRTRGGIMPCATAAGRQHRCRGNGLTSLTRSNAVKLVTLLRQRRQPCYNRRHSGAGGCAHVTAAMCGESRRQSGPAASRQVVHTCQAAQSECC